MSQSSVLVRVCCVCLTAENISRTPLSSHQLFCRWQAGAAESRSLTFPRRKLLCTCRSSGREETSCVCVLAGAESSGRTVDLACCGNRMDSLGKMYHPKNSNWIDCSSDRIGSPHKIITTHETNQDYFLLLKSTTLVTKQFPLSSQVYCVLYPIF